MAAPMQYVKLNYLTKYFQNRSLNFQHLLFGQRKNYYSRDSKRTANTITEHKFQPYYDYLRRNRRMSSNSLLVAFNTYENVGIADIIKKLRQKYPVIHWTVVDHDAGSNLVLVHLHKDKFSLKERMAEEWLISTNRSGFVAKTNNQVMDQTFVNHLREQIGKCENVSLQLNVVYDAVKMPASSLEFHFFLTVLLERCIQQSCNIPNLKVICFGSVPSGTALRGSSDLDIVLFDGGETNVPVLMKLHKVLKRSVLCKNVMYIRHARCPILHMDFTQYNINVDISLNNIVGSLMSNITYLLAHIERRFLKMVLFIKYWAHTNDMAGSLPRPLSVTSYMLTLLMIAYFQKLNILPPLKELYKDPFEPGSPNGNWEQLCKITFREDIAALMSSNSVKTSNLIQGFFDMYANFEFNKNIIDVHNGEIIEGTHYFDIYIANPHEARHNVCRNVPKRGVSRFQLLCQESAISLKGKHEQSSIGIKDSSSVGGKNSQGKGGKDTAWGLQRLLPLAKKSSNEAQDFIENLFNENTVMEIVKTNDSDIEIAVQKTNANSDSYESEGGKIVSSEKQDLDSPSSKNRRRKRRYKKV
ncbi:poly(A) RNA polymerase, mitochondrial-like [Mya arenaria]|uniref:poly(A) RNA polymerase, mitochondrial-like n=1 Tax=Mya arenaria TaxID=6604 RepID=UPI0022E19A96|nr:poly(A) RNA polymerase, mitochondrial-like [Mya arenaria]